MLVSFQPAHLSKSYVNIFTVFRCSQVKAVYYQLSHARLEVFLFVNRTSRVHLPHTCEVTSLHLPQTCELWVLTSYDTCFNGIFRRRNS